MSFKLPTTHSRQREMSAFSPDKNTFYAGIRGVKAKWYL
jgi:hypothetical protein